MRAGMCAGMRAGIRVGVHLLRALGCMHELCIMCTHPHIYASLHPWKRGIQPDRSEHAHRHVLKHAFVHPSVGNYVWHGLKHVHSHFSNTCLDTCWHACWHACLGACWKGLKDTGDPRWYPQLPVKECTLMHISHGILVMAY